MRTTRPLAAMLAVTFAGFAVPSAHAQRADPAQADMHASVALAAATARQQQDARSADARGTATSTRADTASSQQRPSTLVSGAKPVASPTDDGDTANVLGALAGLIVIGLAYLYMRRGHRRVKAGGSGAHMPGPMSHRRGS